MTNHVNTSMCYIKAPFQLQCVQKMIKNDFILSVQENCILLSHCKRETEGELEGDIRD